MVKRSIFFSVATGATLSLPFFTQAQVDTLTFVAGLFNIFVGLMLVLAFLLFFGGLAGWFLRRGPYPSYRDDMIRVLQWAVAIIFVLVVILGAVRFVQTYHGVAVFILGFIFFWAVIWVIMTLVTIEAKKGDESAH